MGSGPSQVHTNHTAYATQNKHRPTRVAAFELHFTLEHYGSESSSDNLNAQDHICLFYNPTRIPIVNIRPMES